MASHDKRIDSHEKQKLRTVTRRRINLNTNTTRIFFYQAEKWGSWASLCFCC